MTLEDESRSRARAGQRRWQLRRATSTDSEFVFVVKKVALGPYVAQTWGWDEAWQRDHHGRHFDPEVLQIIVVDGADAGVLGVVEAADAIDLHAIYLPPELQGQGIGGEIVEWILSFAQESSKPVRLQVLRVNPARRLYARLGFEPCGDDECYFRMEWRPRPGRASTENPRP